MADMQSLLAPYLAEPAPADLIQKLETYLDLLLRWNARTNLTAIRGRDSIIQRHFGESLFLARHLPPFTTLLDVGSGAGFPGIPTQLLHPNSRVTLAESQGKKASFLREAIRTLGLPSEVHAARVETLPAARTFQVITMRAVDSMDSAIAAALPRLGSAGTIAILAGTGTPSLPQDFHVTSHPIPGRPGNLILATIPA